MKNDTLKILAFPLILVTSSFALSSCDVDKVEEGKMPEVEVTEEGKLPKYDVDAPDVDVTTEKKVIEVPKVTITPPADD